MAQGSYSGGIAERYATAVFDLAKEAGDIDALERDLDTLKAAHDESEDFRTLLTSPVYGREAQEKAVAALADRMGLGATMSNTLRLMAVKRRLFAVSALIAALRERIAAERGEVTAEVTSAKALSGEQSKRLSETLRTRFGKDVRIEETIDPAIIGGLIVKVGSKMIDTSIASRLAAMKNTMKEAG